MFRAKQDVEGYDPDSTKLSIPPIIVEGSGGAHPADTAPSSESWEAVCTCVCFLGKGVWRVSVWFSVPWCWAENGGASACMFVVGLWRWWWGGGAVGFSSEMAVKAAYRLSTPEPC